MSVASGDYELLCRGGFGGSSLWLGRDHLLYVDGLGLVLPVRERYRRFAYGDIESLTVCRDPADSAWRWLLGSAAAMAAIGAGALWSGSGSGELIGRGVAWGVTTLAVACAAVWVRDVLRGRRCVCEMRTSTSRVRPRPLRRIAVARAAIERLAERLRDPRTVKSPAPSGEIDVPSKVGRGPEALPRMPRLAGVGFGALGLLAVQLVLTLLLGWAGLAAALVSSTLALAAVTGLLLALAAASQQPAPPGVPALLLVGLGWLALIGALLLSGFSTFAVIDREVVGGSFGSLRWLGSAEVLLPEGLTWCLALACGWGVAPALAGLQRVASENSGAAGEAPESDS